jgi:hypothetical protein
MVRLSALIAVFVLDCCHVDPRAGMNLANPEPVATPWYAPSPRPQVMAPTTQDAPKPSEAPKAPDSPKPQETPKAPDAPQPIPAAPPKDPSAPPAKPEAEPDKQEAAPLDPAAQKIRDETDDARAHDEIAFENEYLRLKERLVPDELGKWLAIVDGRIVPADAHGKPVPTAVFADCVAAADAVNEKALHRFVFRIGEEGDVLYADPAHSTRSVVGTALKSSLGITAGYDPRANELTWTRAGRSHRFKFDHERFQIVLSDPFARQTMATPVVDSAGFGGFLALEANNASVLDGPRFEIPGRVLLRTGDGFQELRRTRIRVRIPELDVDVTVPVAAWRR